MTPNHEVGVQLFTARRNFISNIILDYWSMVNAQKLLPHEHENSEYGNVPSTRFPATEELAFAPRFRIMVYRTSGDFSTKQPPTKKQEHIFGALVIGQCSKIMFLFFFVAWILAFQFRILD